jgi:putative restriction endonuclease
MTVSEPMESVNQLERAFRAWPILVAAAKSNSTIEYGELGKQLGIHHRAVRFVLGKIQEYCIKQGLPPLTILVKNRKGLIGEGFIAWDPEDLESGISKVDGWNWAAEINPFQIFADGTTSDQLVSSLTDGSGDPAEIFARIKVRGMAQIIFRTTMIRVYSGTCAFSGFIGESLLQGAHILPWGNATRAQRLQSNNGILLSVLHHKLFDLDWLRIDADYRIRVNKSAVPNRLSQPENELLASLDGKKMMLPIENRNWPSQELLAIRYSLLE